MGFDSLLGNVQLKENLRASVGRGRASHFYLISGPAGSGKKTLARLLSAALLCKEADKPCMGCSACRKVLSDSHPDVITVVEPERKRLRVEKVRQIREDVYIRPNEGSHKVYIFPQEMGIEGQNALLKVLEEPPAYGVFLILTDNPETVLPTVRSRCTELSLKALSKEVLTAQLQSRFPQVESPEIQAAASRSGGWLGQAITLLEEGADLSEREKQFAQAYGKKSALEIAELFAPMEKYPRDKLLPILQQQKALVQSALLCRSGVDALTPEARQIGERRSPRDLMKAIRALETAIEYVNHNVSPGAICGYLVWALQ